MIINEDTYLLMQTIDEESVAPVIEWILVHNNAPKKSRPKTLNLIISSHGGDMHAQWALVDIMAGSNIPINTIGLGVVASAAFLIFITGKHRVLTPNTTILSHEYSTTISGKRHDLVAVRKEFEDFDKRMLDHYVKYTKLTEKQIKKKLLRESDIYITAEEALELGVCDEIKSLH